MRQPTWYHYLGVLAVAGAGYLLVLATSSHTPRPANVRAPDRPPPPVPLRVDLPRPAVDPTPDPPATLSQQFTPQELAILGGLNPYAGYECGIYTLEEKQRFQQQVEQRKRAFEEAGGNTPAAFPAYQKLLTTEAGRNLEAHILTQLAQIPGDRSAFRPIAVTRIAAYDLSVARSAMKLLAQIATAEDTAAVAAQFRYVEYDDTIEQRGDEYFVAGLEILTKFGGEAEIAKIDQAKDEYLLWRDAEFWKKAEACKAAIRERLAKEKMEKK